MAKSWTRAALLNMEGGTGSSAEAGDISESTPDEQVEVESVATEATGDLEDVSTTAEADIATLEEHEEQLAEAEDNGGVSPEVAQTISASVENIRRRYGALMSGVKKPVRTLEAFTKKDKRQAATVYAREAVMDTLNKVWEAIKQFFIDLAAKIKGWFKNVFDSNTKLKNTVADLRKKISALQGSPTDSTFKNEAWCRGLSLNGSCDENSIKKGTEAMATTMTELATILNDGIKDMDKKDKDLKKLDTSTTGSRAVAKIDLAVELFDSIHSKLNTKNSVTEKEGYEPVEENNVQFVSDEIIGRKVIHAMYVSGDSNNALLDKREYSDLKTALGRSFIRVSDYKPNEQFEEDELPVGDIQDMQTALANVSKIVSNSEKVESKSKELEKALENCAKGVDTVIKGVKDDNKDKSVDTKEIKELREYLVRSMKVIASMLSGFTFGFISHASTTCWTVCKWADRSASFYKKESK